MTGVTKFQGHCEKLVAKLRGDARAAFGELSDDLQRVKFLYELAKESPIELSAWASKDFERSAALKLSGNKLFQSHNFLHAINVYNEALLRCPQDCIDGQALHDVLIGNRSAVFFELAHHEKVLKDVELIKLCNHHPAIHKLLIRAGKSCEALRRWNAALRYYKEAQEVLTSDQVQGDEARKFLVQVNNKLNALNGKGAKDIVKNVNEGNGVSLEFRNMTYPALSSKVCVKSSPELGRYVVAKDEIKAGEVVGVEEPFVCVVNKDMYRSNCACCLISTDQPIACEFCSQACFCSMACKKAANFHRVECKILLSLFDTGASVNCLMAFRIITEKELAVHLEEAEELKKDRNVVIYKTKDYYNVCQLVSHSDSRRCEEVIHYTFMSTYLLRLLKMSGYFGKSEDDSLTEEEAYIGSLILRNLQILQFNAHELSELNHAEDGDCRSETIGAGLYTTLALFNHSCDPSVIRYNQGNVMVLRAIKPIKRNEGVYENYGPLYTNDARDARLRKLKSSYRFDCSCEACKGHWPLFKDISKSVLRIACDCGRVLLADKDIEVFTITCANCKKDKNIIPSLTGLIPLGSKSQKVEALFGRRQYEDCAKLIQEMLQVYAKVLVPPVSDVILLQQRLKTCLIHLGNRHFNYKL